MSLVADRMQTDLDEVVCEGQRLWSELQSRPEYDVLLKECGMYHDDAWFMPRGAMAIPGWNVEEDGVANVVEGIKLAVIYSALSGMVPAPSTVDAAFHAALTQTELMASLVEIGLEPVHQTVPESEMLPYEPGCWTDELYVAIFGEKPNPRYWMPQSQIDRNVDIMFDTLGQFGITRGVGGGSVAEDAYDKMALALGGAEI